MKCLQEIKEQVSELNEIFYGMHNFNDQDLPMMVYFSEVISKMEAIILKEELEELK